jgi:succinoglycan biosynthesis protein ExoM
VDNSRTPPAGLTVAVPTFRRRDRLVTLLPLLLDQLDQLEAAGTGLGPGEVLVVDNDPGGSALPVVQGVADPRLRYAAEPRPGVAAVRNRALAETVDRAVVVFLDDDQRPSDHWLVPMVRTWSGSEAAAVAGPVVSTLPDEVDRWVLEGGFFDRRYRQHLRTGTDIPEVATTNLLLSGSVVRRLGLRFDERFGLSGGEDSLFTRTLTGAGERIVWCAEAAVLEEVPSDRATRSWVCRRALSSGNTAARVDLALERGPGAVLRARLLGRGAVRVAGGALGLAAGAIRRSPGDQGRSARLLCRGAGLLLGALDVSYQEYDRDGRRFRRQPLRSVTGRLPSAPTGPAAG